MEYMHENQHPDKIDAYEECIHILTQTFESPEETVNQIKQFGAQLTLEDRQNIGFLMNGVVAASPEIIDLDDPRSAANMFAHGAMTGLYVADTMLDGYVPVKNVLTTSQDMVNDGAREFYNEIQKFIEHITPEIRQILDVWKSSFGLDGTYGSFFDLGFGVTMASANKTKYEIDLFMKLEDSSDWDSLDKEKPSAIELQSLDEDCMRLAEAFKDHATAIDLNALSDEELDDGMEVVTKLLEKDFDELQDLHVDDSVQTRGLGICLAFEGENSAAFEISDEAKVRGKIIGIECLPVPTEFALFTGITEGDGIQAPEICVLLDEVETMEPSGEFMPRDGVAAIPLRLSGTQLDKIMYQAEK
jgi:hypothetical protein